MAIGDDAAAAGMAVVPSTALVKNGYTELNLTRDYIAQRTSAVVPVAKGGTGSITAAAARTALGADDAANLTAGTLNRPISSSFPIATSGTIAANGDITSNGVVYGNGLGVGVTGAGFTPAGELYSPDARANGVGGGLAIYVDPTGLIRKSTSSQRYKKFIKSLTPDKQAILAIQLVEFVWKESDIVDQGVIAEQLDDLGLEWLIFRDELGRPDGVKYEKLALALLPVVQDHEARLLVLEAAA